MRRRALASWSSDSTTTDAGELVVLAPHGGDIEPHTDDQAELVAAATGCSSWRCKGWRPGGGAHERWHITSTDIDPGSFPLLEPSRPTDGSGTRWRSTASPAAVW